MRQNNGDFNDYRNKVLDDIPYFTTWCDSFCNYACDLEFVASLCALSWHRPTFGRAIGAMGASNLLQLVPVSLLTTFKEKMCSCRSGGEGAGLSFILM